MITKQIGQFELQFVPGSISKDGLFMPIIWSERNLYNCSTILNKTVISTLAFHLPFVDTM